MTPPSRTVLPPRTTTFYLSGRGFGWWCHTCDDGYDEFTPANHWCSSAAGAETLADLHRCDRNT